MAILSKIRERSMFLIIIIGLALFAFVLDPSTLSDFFSSNKVNEIGSVEGESISRQEYLNALEAYQQQTGGRVSEMQAAKTVWNNLIRKKVYENQLEEAGVTIGENDVWNAVINTPSVKNNPQFQNELGMFDENLFKEFLANTKENTPEMWKAWTNFMTQLGDGSKVNTYNNLVTSGLGASLKEGEKQYFMENTKINSQFLFVPFNTVEDNLIDISNADVKEYIKNNEADFKVEDSRDIKYVKFAIEATLEDEKVIKQQVAQLIEDTQDNGVVIQGLKTTKDYNAFLNENDSDISLDENFKFKSSINQQYANQIFELNKDDVFGPYKDNGYIKISKVIEVSKMPDSVRASHILLSFAGAQRVSADTKRTREEAEKLADSILNVVKSNRSKFGDLAKEFSSDIGSAQKNGDLNWFSYNSMVPAFRDYAFANKKGDIGIVESPFGFHIIKIDNQKNSQKVVKLATFGRKIVPSEATENTAFRNAEQFALSLSKKEDIEEVAKKNNYDVKLAVGLKLLDESIPGLGNQRQIVSWAFSKSTEVNSFKRFDLEGSYVVALLKDKTKKGLMPVEKAMGRVKPILLNKKKAELISNKFNGTTLEEIAKENNTIVRKASNINLKAATISGAGFEPNVVGAMYYAENGKLYTNVVGNRGVYAFVVTEKILPTALPNYETSRTKIAQNRKQLTYRIYDAVKGASEIEDNRKAMYVTE